MFPLKIVDKFSTVFVTHLVSIVWPIALISFLKFFYQTREREDDEIVEALNRYTVKLQNSLQIINSTEMWFSFFLYCKYANLVRSASKHFDVLLSCTRITSITFDEWKDLALWSSDGKLGNPLILKFSYLTTVHNWSANNIAFSR